MPSRKTAGRQQLQKNMDIWIGEVLRFSCLSFLFPLGVAVDCGFLESPPNGGIAKKTGKTFGAIYVFECDEDKGYLMDGSKERRCQADATWSGVQPVCKCRFHTFHWYKPFILKRAGTKLSLAWDRLKSEFICINCRPYRYLFILISLSCLDDKVKNNGIITEKRG